MTRFEECKKHTMRMADTLVDAIRAKKLASWAADGIMESFLEQPAYDVTYRQRLHDMAMDYIEEKLNGDNSRHKRTLA